MFRLLSACLILCAVASATAAADERAILVPQLGHTGYVRCLAVSPDGRFLATGSADQSILVWEVATRRVWADLRGHQNCVLSVAWSPDGRTLASSSADGTVRRWDAVAGRALGEPLRRHGSHVGGVAWSPDGKTLASAGGYGEGSLCRWDAATGQPLGDKLDTGRDAVAFSPDGALVATATDKGELQFVDAKTGRCSDEPLAGHAGGVCGIAFSPQGKCAATGGTDGSIRLWDVASRRCLATFRATSAAVNSVAWRPDGAVLASGSDDGTVQFWDAGGKPLGDPLRTDRVFAVAWHPGGKSLLVGCHDGTAQAWDLATRKPSGESFGCHASPVRTLAWQPHGDLLAYTCMDGSSGLWDLRRAEAFGPRFAANAVAWSPDGKLLASAGTDLIIRVWNAETGRSDLPALAGHTEYIASLAWSLDGKLLASGSYDRTVRLWNPLTGQAIGAPWSGHEQIVNGVTFSPDSRLVASAAGDCTVRLWDVGTGALKMPPLRHTSHVASVAFSPDGRYLAAGEGNGSTALRVWDMTTGAEARPVAHAHGDGLSCVAWSPDGRWLASASGDGTVRLWDGPTGPPVGEPLVGHSGAQLSLAWSPDGRTLACGSSAVTLWSAEKRAPRAFLYSLDRGAASLMVTPDGYYAGTMDGARRVIWRMGQALHPAEQFESRFRRPDLVAAAVAGAVPTDPQPALTSQDVPPTVTIDVTDGQTVVTTDQVRVRVQVKPSRPGGQVSRVEVRINGRLVDLDHARDVSAAGGAARSVGLGSGQVPVTPQAGQEALSIQAALRLLPGETSAKLTASAWDDRELRGDSGIVSITRRAGGVAASTPSANLYVLAIGVSRYRSREFNLSYADADARDLAACLALQEGRAFGRVASRVLANEQATLAEVRAGFAWLRTAPTERDTAIILLGGHGLRGQSGRLYFGTHEMDLDSLRDTCLPWTEVAEVLASCRAGQRLLFLDCCHAGSFGLTAEQGARFVFVPMRSPLGQWAAGADDLTREATATTGALVLAGCKGSEVAFERADWGHGAFTRALIEGLDGKADPYQQGVVTMANLLGYVQARVGELTEKRQTPWIPRAEQFDTSLVLARVR